MSYINIALNITRTLYEGDMVSVHIMIMESRPVDPGSIQGNHRPTSFITIKHRTRANDILCKIENYYPYRRFSSQKPYHTNVSDVPRSLQSGVSTIQTVVLTADVFQLSLSTSLTRVTKSYLLALGTTQITNTMSISSQTALSTSTRWLAAHIMHAWLFILERYHGTNSVIT